MLNKCHKLCWIHANLCFTTGNIEVFFSVVGGRGESYEMKGSNDTMDGNKRGVRQQPNALKT